MNSCSSGSDQLPPPATAVLGSDIDLPDLGAVKPTFIYDIYWRFAAERQAIFFRRILQADPPWTRDPVLRDYKFTNVYRASDRVSQYLIQEVIYRDDLPTNPQEVVFRILLFKIFNRIETWELLEEHVGQLTYESFSQKRYDRVLTHAIERGRPLYSAAYIMPPSRHYGHKRKHRDHLALLQHMMSTDFPTQIAEAQRMEDAFKLLQQYPTVGPFLAYQYATDINYSTVTDFSEREFVAAGPGAKAGIRKCFSNIGAMDDADIINMMVDRQALEFDRLGVEFRDLWGRPLQLIDCQNLFCEVDKYTRVTFPGVGPSKRRRIKQKFRPSDDMLEYWFPPKWGINGEVKDWNRGAL